MATINLFNEGVRFPFRSVKKKEIISVLSSICRHLELEQASVTVIAVNDEYIRTINKKYRKKDRPTDVISFPFGEGSFPEGGGMPNDLGEIYLSMERASAQAREYGVTLIQEVARLLVHGILHLLGYDHEGSTAEAKKMERLEETLLALVLKKKTSQ